MRAPGFTFDREGMRIRLILMVAISVILSVTAVGAVAISAFDRAVEPELSHRVRLIGSTLRGEIQRALDLGIPLESISGLDAYLKNALEDFGEIDRISVLNAQGDLVAVSERESATAQGAPTGFGQVASIEAALFELPILEGNTLIGTFVIETDPHFVRTRLRQVFIDVVVIVLVAIVVAMEAAFAVAMSSVGKPLDRILRLLREQVEGRFNLRIRPGGLGGLAQTVARFNDHAEDLSEKLVNLPASARKRIAGFPRWSIAEGRPLRLRLSEISDIRIALFLFSVSAETAVAFLPLYARAATRPDWLSAEFAAALPLIVYLLAMVALSPFAGTIAGRFGPRRIFLASVAPNALALLALGFADSLIAIALLRGAMAISYATATIGCQTYAIRAGEEAGSARPFGTFMAVVYGGVFCGSALGGLVAGRLGYGSAFVFGASICLASGAAGWFAMRGRAGDMDMKNAMSAAARGRMRFSVPFAALLAGVAVPMNATIAVFIWYLTPLMLASNGLGPAEIARVVMLYYLAVILLGPAVSYLSDRGPGPAVMVTAGGLLSAGALFSLSFWSGFWAMAVAVAILGIGHTFIRAPQYALAVRMTGATGRGLDYLRAVERLGALAGLGIAALTVGNWGGEQIIRILALIVLSGILVHMGAGLASRSRRQT